MAIPTLPYNDITEDMLEDMLELLRERKVMEDNESLSYCSLCHSIKDFWTKCPKCRTTTVQ